MMCYCLDISHIEAYSMKKWEDSAVLLCSTKSVFQGKDHG